MQGIKYHSPKRHKKSLKHARLLVLQRFYFLRTVKDGIIPQFAFPVYLLIPGKRGTATAAFPSRNKLLNRY